MSQGSTKSLPVKILGLFQGALLGALLLAGCGGGGGHYIRHATIPRVQLQRVTVGQINPHSIELHLHMLATNPYSVPLPAVGLKYRIWLSGVALTSGSAQLATSIPPQGSTPLTTTLRFGPIDAARVAARYTFGKRGYRVRATLLVNTPAGQMAIPFDTRGKITATSLIKKVIRLVPGI